MFADDVIVRLLHISDVHFGPPYLPKVGEAVLRIAPTLEAHAIVRAGESKLRRAAVPKHTEREHEWIEQATPADVVTSALSGDPPRLFERRTWAFEEELP